MIAIDPNHREFPEDERFSELRKMESARLARMRGQYIADIREAFLQSIKPRPVKPAYVDYVGDFRKHKDPVNFALHELYNEEL